MDGMPQNRETYEELKNSVFYEIERLTHFAEKVQKLAKELNDISRNIVYIYNKNNIPEKSNEQNRTNLQNLTNEQKHEITTKIKKHQDLMFRNLSELERQRQLTPRAIQVALETYVKLTKLGYTDKLIDQAIHDACTDSFWSRQFRAYPKLLRKNKDGVYYIDVFLSINQHKHKLFIPKVIR